MATKKEKEEILYRLANTQTQFCEGEFTLTGDQEKPLPKNPSLELLARIKAGFIVEVK